MRLYAEEEKQGFEKNTQANARQARQASESDDTDLAPASSSTSRSTTPDSWFRGAAKAAKIRKA